MTPLRRDWEGSRARLPPAPPAPLKGSVPDGGTGLGNSMSRRHGPRAGPEPTGPREQRPWWRAMSLQAGPEPCPPPRPCANSLPNLVDDPLLLLDLVPESGQLPLVGLPVAFHLLLQRLLRTRPGDRVRPSPAPAPAHLATGPAHTSQRGQDLYFLIKK